jgi:hypothetical protein
VQLHISHSRRHRPLDLDYCRTDTTRRNLLLRSRSHRNAAGFRLELVEPAVDAPPLLAWDLARRSAPARHPTPNTRPCSTPCSPTSTGSILVSSLIGHSLEALSSGLPTVVVLHDLFPFCPALFACFDGACSDCAGAAPDLPAGQPAQRLLAQHRGRRLAPPAQRLRGPDRPARGAGGSPEPQHP